MKQFTEWTPELAYFLGWMITDGYISDKAIHIELAAKDREVLEHLNEWIPEASLLGPYEKTYNGVTTYSYRLTLSDEYVRNHLVEYWGILPNKTGKECIPFEVPEDMLPHLFRGLFDGDGGSNEKKRGDHEAEFTSASTQLLRDIQKLHGGNKGRRIRPKKDGRPKLNGEPRMTTYTWEFGRRESRKLRDFIYVEGHYALPRKKEKMIKLFGPIQA